MGIILLSQLFLIFLYIIYLIIKQDSEIESCFVTNKQINFQDCINLISTFEKLNNKDYSKVKKNITFYFSDNILTEAELNRIDDLIIDSYYDNYSKKFVAFRKADFFSKLINFTVLLASVIYFNLIFTSFNEYDSNLSLIIWQSVLTILLFIIPLVFYLTQVGVISLFLMMISVFFPNKGSIRLARVTFDEIIKSLKPGGRKTRVILQGPRIGRGILPF